MTDTETQALRAIAEELRTDHYIYYLDKILDSGVMTTDTFKLAMRIDRIIQERLGLGDSDD